MQLQAFTIVMTDTADARKHETCNHRSADLGFTDEVLQAICDEADTGLKVEDENGTRYMSPVSVCKEYIIPRLLEIHMAQENRVSTTFRINGESHCASIKIGLGDTIKHNVNKRISKVVWNYAWVTSGHIVMFYIGKRKQKSVALRDRNGNAKHLPAGA
tara:strand:+ start:7776 stop:8252 length:477 start_codon:yes stop_codon:yes gene_type:complete